MGSLKSPLLLATGILIGLGAAVPLARALFDDPAHVEIKTASATRVAELEQELKAERASHAETTTPRETPAMKQESVAPAASAALAAAPALTPEAIKARVERVPAEIAARFQAKDGKGVVALLRELAQLGPLAGKAALGLAVKLLHSIDQDNPLGINVNDFYKAARSGDFPELYKDALENPEGHDTSERRLAARELPWTDLEGVNAIFLARLTTETDRSVLSIMTESLSERPAPENVDPIADALRTQKSPRLRSQLIEALAAVPGDQATQALSAYVPVELDSDVKEEAEVALKARLATVTGYLVTSVGDESQAQLVGIKVGDIVTSYRGNVVTSNEDLDNAKTNVLPEDQVPIVISRDGQSLQVTIKGPRIGINGRFVRPDAH